MSQAIQALDTATIRSLHSGQIVTDLEAIVKELVENALDAGATNIEVKLVNSGLRSIHVKDNGSGIKEEDRAMMAKKHYTSKISSFNDLENLKSFGFRGEALSAICAVADTFQLTTKTRQDKVAKQYELDKEGSHISEKPSANIGREGTLVLVTNPFQNLPVRRQIAQKTAAASAKKIHELLVKYGLSHPTVRFMLLQTSDTVGNRNKDQRWIKPNVSNTHEAITAMYDKQLADMLEVRTAEGEDGLRLECILPKREGIDPAVVYRGDRVFIYVNKRPINYARSDLKEMISLARNKLRQILGLADDDSFSRKTPFLYVNITVPPAAYDVNIEPNKSAVMFHYKQRVINLFEDLLEQAYGSPFKLPNVGNQPLPEKELAENSETTNRAVIASDTLVVPEATIPSENQPTSVDDVQTEKTTIEPAAKTAHSHEPRDEEAANIEDEGQASAWIFDQFSKGMSESDEEDADQVLPDKHAVDTAPRQVPTLKDWLNTPTVLPATTPIRDASIEILRRQERQQSPALQTSTEQLQSGGTAAAGLFLKYEMNCQIESDSLARPPDEQHSTGHHQRDKNLPSRPNPPDILQHPQTTSRGEKRRSDIHSMQHEKRQRCDVEEAVAKDRITSPVSPSLRDIQRSSSPFSNILNRQQPSNLETAPSSPPALDNNRQKSPTPSSNAARQPVQADLQRFVALFGKESPIKNNKPLDSRSGAISSKFRNTALLLGEPTNSRDILNLETTASIDMQQISSNYIRQRPTLLQNFSHWSVQQLLKRRIKNSVQPPLTIYSLDDQLALYTTLSDSHDKNEQTRSIGAVDMKNARRAYKYHQYMKEKQLVCKKRLKQPIQVELGPLDPLGPVIQSLQSRKEQILEDGHGYVNIMYHVVTDPRVVSNGFQCRWRKETDHVTIVQITGIFHLGSTFPYGAHDFRELLLLLRVSDDASCAVTSLAQTRPAQLAKYFKHLADQDWPQKEPDTKVVLETLNELLEWKETITDAGCPVLVGSATLAPDNEHIPVACTLL